MDFVQLMTTIGVVSLLLAGLMVGSWTNGDRQRANFATEDTGDRPMKNRIAGWSASLAVIAFAIAAAGHYWF